IGRPLPNTTAHVLDGQMRPVPVGAPGELYLGADCVTRGYLNQPVLTADRFVPDPFANIPGSRLYRTGDRVRWLARGYVEFLGRFDEQVKIRGFRIEPAEIESVLCTHVNVAEAAVTIHEKEAGEKHLSAYVVLRNAAVDTPRSLHSYCQGVLPGYM